MEIVRGSEGCQSWQAAGIRRGGGDGRDTQERGAKKKDGRKGRRQDGTGRNERGGEPREGHGRKEKEN